MRHGELHSDRGSRLVKFVLWIFINFKDTFKTGEALFYIFLKLVFFTNDTLGETRIPKSERSSGQKMEEARKVVSVANDKSKKQKRGYSGSTKSAKNKKTVRFATLMDICHVKNAELEPKCQRPGCAPEVTL